MLNKASQYGSSVVCLAVVVLGTNDKSQCARATIHECMSLMCLSQCTEGRPSRRLLWWQCSIYAKVSTVSIFGGKTADVARTNTSAQKERVCFSWLNITEKLAPNATMIAWITSFLRQCLLFMKLRRDEQPGEMSLQEASDRVAAILNDPDIGSTTQDYNTIKTLILQYPQIARMEIVPVQSGNVEWKNPPIAAFATKRIGSKWDEHMHLLELLHVAFPKGIENRDANGCTSLHIACTNRMPSFVVLFLLDKFPRASMISDNAGAWPLLYEYLRDGIMHKKIVTSLVGVLSESFPEDQCCEGRLESVDLPSPSLVVFALKIARKEMLRVLFAPDSYAILDLVHGDTSQLAPGSIDTNVADLLARRIGVHIQRLCLDTNNCFTCQGFVTFLSTLAETRPVNLASIELIISLDTFNGELMLPLLDAVSRLFRESYCVKEVKLRVVLDYNGSSEVDLLVSVLAKGLAGHDSLESLSLEGLDGATMYGLEIILSTCSKLRSISLKLQALSDKASMSLRNGFNNSRSLESVHLEFDDGMTSEEMNRAIEAVACSSSVTSLEVIHWPSCGRSKSLLLPGIARLTNLSSLYVSVSCEDISHEHGIPNAVLELLETSNNLVALTTSQIYLSPTRLLEALKRNAVLQSFHMMYGNKKEEAVGVVVEALQQSNGTLRHVSIEDFDDEALHYGYAPTHLETQLDYSLRLNRAGRAEVMVSSANASTVVQVLGEALRDSSNDEVITTSMCYSLLRESPHLWSNQLVGRPLVGEADATTLPARIPPP